MTKTNKKSAFTMVEIIAVLVIIGIMTAVAAPKFIGMAAEARNKAVVAGISEAKASLSVGYAKAYLSLGGEQPTVAQVATAAFGTATDVEFGDVTVKIVATADPITLTATGVAGTKLENGTATGSWDLPTNVGTGVTPVVP